MNGIATAVVVSALCAAAARAQTTTRVSVATDGTQANNRSYSTSISGDGHIVAFDSLASNLISGDTNGTWDVFVHDSQTGQTIRVSVAADGTEGNDASLVGSISADGRFVAFSSLASNLVPGDSNGSEDVFVCDRQTGQIRRVSIATDGTQGNSASIWPYMSPDGRFVAFTSSAFNLCPGDTNNNQDAFVHDIHTGQTSRLSISIDGTQGNHGSRSGSISADNRFVAFSSYASNLVPNDTNGRYDAFIHDRQTGQITLVSVATSGTQGNGHSLGPEISADGRFVGFHSAASTLVPGDTNGKEDMFLHDRQTGQTTLVSVATSGAQGNGDSYIGSISADGRFVAFQSYASNLVPGDTNADPDVFVHDRQTGQTTRVSVATDGTEGDSGSGVASISANGRFVAFLSYASNFVPGDPNGRGNIFVRDRCPRFSCFGDANADGTVNFVDITDVLTSWGAEHTPCTGTGDANHDGEVAIADITSVLENWGALCPP